MNLLTLLTFLPVAGILPILFMKDAKAVRWTATAVCFVEMILSIWLWLKFDAAAGAKLGASAFALFGEVMLRFEFHLHFDHGLVHRHLRTVGKTEHRFGPSAECLVLRTIEPQLLGNEDARERKRHVGDELAPTRVDEAIDQLMDDALDGGHH